MPHSSVCSQKLYQQIKYHRRNDAATGREFDITVNDILEKFQQQDGLCHWSGVPMTLPDVGRRMTDVSLDRLDCAVGHTKANTVLCCQSINFMRNSYSEVELEEFLQLVRDHHPQGRRQ